MGRLRRWSAPGKWMRERRELHGLTSRQVDRATRQIAKLNGDDGLHVSRSYLRNIELGHSMPSRQRMRSLAEVYGEDLAEVGRHYLLLLPSSSLGPNHLIKNEKERQLVLAVAREFRSTATRVLTPAEEARVIPAGWSEHVDEKHIRYGIVGTEDHRMGEFLAADYLVTIDCDEKTIQEETLPEIHQERPIHMFLTDEGYICCWAYRKRGKLKLVTYQGGGEHEAPSEKASDVDIIGRVICAWCLPRDETRETDGSPDGKPKADAS